MTVAQYIAEELAGIGIKFMFGIPGGPSIPYMDAFKSAGIEFILTSNEATAGIMADVTARLTGIPGICHSTFGPGATNLSTGVGGAFLDRSPVIAFTSEIDDRMINRVTQMNVSHQQLFAPLTKATFRLNENNAGKVLQNALRISLEEYPGPVHIGLPSDLSGKTSGVKSFSGCPEGIPVSDNDTHRLKLLLSKSRKPILAAGLTAFRSGVSSRLLSFLEIRSMPVVLTPMAKGLIPEDHPCYAGVLFHALSNKLEPLYENCDLVIGLGYDPVEFNYESWMPDVPLASFDVVKPEVPAGIETAVFRGEPEEWFVALEDIDPALLKFDVRKLEEIRDSITSAFLDQMNHFGPVAVFRTLEDEPPAGSILTADVGSHLHVLGQYWKSSSHGRLIMTNGWSGMGFGLPAALAAQLNEREKTVVCITGDGGFLMVAGEIITARRYNLPVITIVLSDRELNLIRVKQSWKNLPPYGTKLYDGDLFGSDTFFGVPVMTAGSVQTLKAAVRAALSMRKPVIINAVIDPAEYNQLIVRR
jgi:acetolactate synthase-1/2/3 large subunit